MPSQDSKKWTEYINVLIASELSRLTRYYDRVIQWLPRKEDSMVILDRLDNKQKEVVQRESEFPNLQGEVDKRTAVLMNGTLNHHYDIEALLRNLKQSLSRTSRVLLVMYNPYLAWFYTLANKLRVRKGPLPTTFVTRTDLENFAKLSGYNIVRTRNVAFIPWRLLGIGTVLNNIFSSVPIVRWLSFVYLVYLQPVVPEQKKPSLSIVVPARNESGNIENIINRIESFPADIELIFVEGDSTDNTWDEILRVKEKYQTSHIIHAYQQTGKGKADAVRLGFSYATGELLTILDADLTMPPEQLVRFYNAYSVGHADFINGSRLVYPMEGGAMRVLNRLGNVFFAHALSWILDARLGDSLCGTKLFAKHDYARMQAWREDFGDFDPFGDFEIIFPAQIMGLGSIDIPIRYLARTYGETNISRFRHGLILFKMSWIGLVKIKLGFEAEPRSR
jgi:hypothetical protein